PASLISSSIGQPLNGPSDIAMLGVKVRMKSNAGSSLVGFIVNPRMKVVSTLQASMEDFLKITNQELQDYSRTHGGTRLLIHGQAASKEQAEAMILNMRDMNYDRRLLEMVVTHPDGYVSALEWWKFQRPDDSFFGVKSSPGERVQDSTFSLSASAIGDLEKLIAQKLTEGPAERAQILQTLRNRLGGVLQRQEDITDGVHPLLKRGSMDPVQTDRPLPAGNGSQRPAFHRLPRPPRLLSNRASPSTERTEDLHHPRSLSQTKVGAKSTRSYFTP
ncbi:MAG: hypothetical protein WCH40_02965, partial [Verrucomicrobiales bacterium]